MFNLQKITHIRQVLTIDVFRLVTSHLDYTNALYIGVPDSDITKLKHVQNVAAKVVRNKTKYNSATDALKELLWPPVRFRFIHKTLALVYERECSEISSRLST